MNIITTELYSLQPAIFNNEASLLTGYRVTLRYDTKQLTNSPFITANTTAINMSQYFSGHPQFYLIYNITVQALYTDGMVAANKSEYITISELYSISCNSWHNQHNVTLGTFVLRDCLVTGSYPSSHTTVSLPSGVIRIFCSFVGVARQISISITCDDCGTPQPPVTMIGASPMDIPDFSAANYTVEIYAVDNSEKRVEDNTIVKPVIVFTGM